MTRHLKSIESATLNPEKAIKLLFNLFEKSTKMASFPFSIELIISSLLQ